MVKNSAAVLIVIAVMMVGLLAVPSHAGAATTSTAPTTGPAVHSVAGLVPTHVVVAKPLPTTTFPRTVIAETFTGEWCYYCTQESQALYWIQRSYGTNVLSVGELHWCYAPCSNGDNYLPADSTTITRASYYGVNAFPTVYFDGTHGRVGAASSLAALESIYQGFIQNASMIPGNVSIAQTATVSSSGVTVQANITSAVTGTYHALSYLVEFIGKNDSATHYIGDVVRLSMIDRTVSLTAGATLAISGTGALAPGWNVQQLSAITLVQQNSTKIIENANMVAVSTMAAAVTVSPAAISSGTSSAITVRAANSTTGTALSGATVSLTSSGGGSFSPANGYTASDGTFASTYTAPRVTATQTIVITAQVSEAGYTAGVATASLVVNAIAAPSAPIGLTLTPASPEQVVLSWGAPASGAGGVTYHVYRSTSQVGGYSALGTSTTPTYVDNGLLSGQSYWYRVNAQNLGGFSLNTTEVSASAVTAVTQGLPSNVGWWLSIDSLTLHATTDASLALHLPDGLYPYDVGADAYAYVATDASGSVTVAGASTQFSVSFSPRYATLQGTVHPASANVALDGTAIAVVGGSFMQVLKAGTYTLSVTLPGYQANVTSVKLTPGNITNENVQLQLLPAPPGTSITFAGLTGGELGALAAIAVAIGVAAVVGVMMMSKRKKGSRSASRSPRQQP